MVKESAPPAGERRLAMLKSALDTFARHGYRTSMEDVAWDVRISRPRLYLYFSSKKQALLHAAGGSAYTR